jgi:sugar diacid utilization regulator/GAF domain-containing protein
MTPSERSPLALLRHVDTDHHGDELDVLLAGMPAASATAELAAVASRLVGTSVAIGYESGGEWSLLPGTPSLAGPSPTVIRRRIHRQAGAVQAGGIALVWDPVALVGAALRRRLQQACVWVALAIERDDASQGADQAMAETTVIRDVVAQLLSVRDVDQVLLSIADRTLRLLHADICGVLLREGDEVRMRSCVGNRVIDTARLRMRRGQGVAGLVFLTGEPAKVDSYLADETISQDFMSLAEQEQTQSALAVPLRLHGELIGVLEVWRRRHSVFTEQDVRRMVTLADFATIAIDNARLHDEQACAVSKMEQTRDALENQVAILARSSSLQQTLLSTVLEGGGLPAIARTVAAELDCQIRIYGPEGAVVASHGGRRMVADLPAVMLSVGRTGRTAMTVPSLGDTTAWVQPVFADGDQVGCVCMLPGPQSAEMMDIVAVQVAMACSLALLRQRAASRARSEALEQVLWDLLQGPVEHRVAARTRAQQMNVALKGELRVLYGQIENVEELAAEHGWDTSQVDRVRRDVLRTIRSMDDGRGLSLASLRGNLIVAIAADLDPPTAKELVNGLTVAVRTEWTGLRLTWGVSRPHSDVVALPSALNEAKTALSAAHRLGGDNVFLYEELGIVRLLLGSGSDPDLQTFIDDVTGPLIAYDRENDGSLIRTLRAFFDANCSQRVAAERLFVHHKTLRYRLERIKQLTGLDLSRHEDRMRADFALRLLQINGAIPDEQLAGDSP